MEKTLSQVNCVDTPMLGHYNDATYKYSFRVVEGECPLKRQQPIRLGACIQGQSPTMIGDYNRSLGGCFFFNGGKT